MSFCSKQNNMDQQVLVLDPFKRQNDMNNHSPTKLNISRVKMSDQFHQIILKTEEMRKDCLKQPPTTGEGQ